MKLEQGTRCWIPDDRQGWNAALVTRVEYDATTKRYQIEVTNENETKEKYIVETSDLSETNDKIPKLRNMDDTVDDLTTLSHLNEPSVLNSVKLRYSVKKIYTFSGVVLIAINPFAKINELYTYSVIQKYLNTADKSTNTPHVFSIANEAYKTMKNTGCSQSIIVSGESGAGKTVSAKYIMRFFASVHSSSIDTTEIEKQILATNPIMESFGNAKTTRNDNSSRFGKYLKISFDENSLICGAKIQTYLLERSRVVHQAVNERNYHIFYQLLMGLDDETKNELHLTNAQDYNYLNNGGESTVLGTDDARDFIDTCDALEVIGIESSLRFELFKILSGLLHIGNIDIHDSRGQAHVSAEDPNLLIACELLGLNSTEFCKLISKKLISTRSDSISSTLKYHEAIVSRDSIAKFIYSSLFDWLVSYINADLHPSDAELKSKTFVGVLDIYGFEHFDDNSFEQFCINYANEKLQQDFTKHVFKLQQDEYINEGIEWSFIKYSDNQPCIDLIEDKQGILSLLDEQCKLPSGSDKLWAEKMFSTLTKPPHSQVFKKGRFGYEKFVVSHYALDVTYEVEGFLEKNRDNVSEGQTAMLTNSSNGFMRNLLAVKAPSEKNCESTPSKRPTTITRNKKPTLGHIFKNSLKDLMSTLSTTDAHYIRCIKPNETKTPWEFDNLMVLSQLRACGVLETIRISLVGFPSKYTFEEFLGRFSVLIPPEDELAFKIGEIKAENKLKELSLKILRFNISDHSLYQVGKTKLFFRAGVLGQLEFEKTKKLTACAIVLQKHIRGFLMKRRYTIAKQSHTELQAHIRGSLVRSRIRYISELATTIQSLFRGYISRKSCAIKKTQIIQLQSLTRGFISRRNFSEMRAKERLKAEEELRKLKKEQEEIRLQEQRAEQKAKEEAEKRRLHHQAEITRLREQEEKDKLDRNQLEAKMIKCHVSKLTNQHKITQLAHQSDGEDATTQSGSTTLLNSPLKEISLTDDDDYRRHKPLSKHEIRLLNKIESSSKALKYSQDDLLGMKPTKALNVSTNNLVTKLQSISTTLNEYENKNEVPDSYEFDQSLSKTFKNDVQLFKKMMRRCRYARPEVDNKRNSVRSTSSISTEKIMFGRNSTDSSDLEKTYRTAHADLMEYKTESKIAASIVASLLLEDIQPPKENVEHPAEIAEILLPARYATAIINELWNNDMVNQSVIFLEKNVEEMKMKLKSLKDSDDIISVGCYLLNNLNEIRSSITITRFNLMRDFDGEYFKAAADRDTYLKMLLIMKRYCETVFGQMYNYWINSILNDISKKAIDAIVLDDVVYNYSKNSQTSLKQLFQRTTKYKMFDLIRVFSNVHLALKSYSFDDTVLSSVIHDMLIHTDLICFNDIINRDGYFIPERGSILKYNLSLLNDWCHENHISDVPDKLIHLLSLTYVLMQKNMNVPDKDIIAAFNKEFDPKTIRKILYECDINSDHKDHIDKTIIDPTDRSFDYSLPYTEDAFENILRQGL